MIRVTNAPNRTPAQAPAQAKTSAGSTSRAADQQNLAARAGWLTQAPARAEPSSGFAASSRPPPRSATLRQPATHGRVTGSLPPALAGQISALIPSPRHAPLSHNGPWWIAEILFRGIPPRYLPRPLCEAAFASLRSAWVLLSRHRASFTAWGRRWLALANCHRITPPALGPAAVGIACARPQLCGPTQRRPRGRARRNTGEVFVTIRDKRRPIFCN